ncbi:hypothetical protein [Halovivax gelatinilyticus]|uniref:hypothetical protein n=1 Tax=Halovivax gelatinilyticus TaxID=2961597 RepID=UPI0020CA2814|nr:hypothetical protein [Halovivax gelatinilyticus]
MDERLIVTVSFAAYLFGGLIFTIAYTATDATFAGNQHQFLVGVGFICPLVGLALIWLRSYDLGAALYVLSTAATSWYVLYHFVLGDSPAAVFHVGGEASEAYTVGVVVLFLVSIAATLVGFWLWYRSSQGLRTVVEALLGRSGSAQR